MKPVKTGFSKKAAKSAALLALSLGLACLSCTMTGCSRKSEIQQKTVDDNVAGFLFHFDQRAETAALKASVDGGKYPVKVTWVYGKPVLSDETEGLPAPVTVEDPEKIQEIYASLSNVIIVGNAGSHLADMGYYITFTLEDGSECRFDFISENTIRLSEHNYSIESDGTLWTALQ